MLPQISARLRRRAAKTSTPSFSTSDARLKLSCASPKVCGFALVDSNQLTAAGKDPSDPCLPEISDPGRLRVNRASGLHELSEPREDLVKFLPVEHRGIPEENFMFWAFHPILRACDAP